MDIKIEWIDDLITKIWKLAIRKTLDTAIKKSVFTIERTAKQRTPVDTWVLRNSYETRFKEFEWEIRNFREYAPFVEARVGFLESTLSDEANNIQNIFNTEIENLLKSLE